MTTSLKTGKVYDDIIEFIAAGTTPETVIKFKLSAASQERLDYFMVLEHIIRLPKARAHQLIKSE
ncbi:MAG: hypothetical protein VKL59_04845 [Nostocaceae cyanobacterium]|nr:hypothetical protein [Nostocaceae cyanobacterium]